MKRRTVVLVLTLLLGISIAAPALAYAQELLPAPDMVAPIALITFGFLGLIGGVTGYVWRHRPIKPSKATGQPELTPEV
jgi:hypothetical protein